MTDNSINNICFIVSFVFGIYVILFYNNTGHTVILPSLDAPDKNLYIDDSNNCYRYKLKKISL